VGTVCRMAARIIISQPASARRNCAPETHASNYFTLPIDMEINPKYDMVTVDC
jgi:hypothetical protein